MPADEFGGTVQMFANGIRIYEKLGELLDL